MLSARDRKRSPQVQEMLLGISNRHRQAIKQHLEDGTTPPARLWLAVGYFYAGSGMDEDRSFISEEQWQQLLKDTGRKQ